MSRLLAFVSGAAVGAAATHFLDPDSGRKRRSQLRDQATAKASSAASQATSAAGQAADKAKGAVATAAPTGTPELDDVALARKVETEIFRDPDAPKGGVSVDVQAAVVYLRGEVADESWILRFADGAGKVDGIKGVKNLLHAPGTPAPAAEPRSAVQDR
jgi:osmotically-inducible protein OsmY